MVKFRIKRITKHIGLYVLVCTVCVLIVFPFYWLILSSLTPQQIFDPNPSLFTLEISTEIYRTIFVEHPLARWLFNSSLVAVLTALFAITISCFAAYSLSRFDFRGRFSFIVLLVVTQMIPFALIVIPLYIIFRSIGLLNNLMGLVIAYVTFAIPLCTLLLKGFFDSIPKAIEESALIDGCSRIGAFLRVILPIALPGLGVTALFAFLHAWNEYVFAATLLHDSSKYTTSIGLYSFMVLHEINWEALLAASVVVTIPTFVMFSFLQKTLIKGIGFGALKE